MISPEEKNAEPTILDYRTPSLFVENGLQRWTMSL